MIEMIWMMMIVFVDDDDDIRCDDDLLWQSTLDLSTCPMIVSVTSAPLETQCSFS